MIVAIHQPNYLPWLGYFYKIAHCDAFIFLDHVFAPNRSYLNRCQIKTHGGVRWLTVPVRHSSGMRRRIIDLEIDNSTEWRRLHLETLRRSYRRAPYFDEVYGVLGQSYAAPQEEPSLCALNMRLISSICRYMGLVTPCVLSTSLMPSCTERNEMIIELCARLGATTYLSGNGAKAYQDDAKFDERGIRVCYSAFAEEVRPQFWGEFAAGLSAVDALMNLGPGTARLLQARTAPDLEQNRTAATIHTGTANI